MQAAGIYPTANTQHPPVNPVPVKTPAFQQQAPVQQQSPQSSGFFHWGPQRDPGFHEAVCGALDSVRHTLILAEEKYNPKSWFGAVNPWDGASKFKLNFFSVDNSVNIGNRVTYNNHGNSRSSDQSRIALGIFLAACTVAGFFVFGTEQGHIENCSKGIKTCDRILKRGESLKQEGKIGLNEQEITVFDTAKDVFKEMRKSSQHSVIFKGILAGGLALAAVGAFFAELNAIVLAVPLGLSLALAGAIGLAIRAGVNYSKGFNSDILSNIHALIDQINRMKPQVNQS